ncbi:MAG: LptF/LptG family permease, partial [Gemmatimonadota bacterium]|nr:LptF/LptG family permease [Gemmatimonadota bacterium]
MKTLDRYVLRSWVLIFSLTALGFPIVSLLINMTENLPRLLDRGLHFPVIVLSYVYAMPAEIAQVMPAAVLFATVFTVGNLGRHSELTAAKAGGYSFYRLA